MRKVELLMPVMPAPRRRSKLISCSNLRNGESPAREQVVKRLQSGKRFVLSCLS